MRLFVSHPAQPPANGKSSLNAFSLGDGGGDDGGSDGNGNGDGDGDGE